MKRLFAAIMLAATFLANTPVFADDIYREDESFSAPSIEAESALLMDLKSGRVIYSKNPDQRVFPASTTKILTGILALELCEDLNQEVTATVAALAPITNEDSHMGILIGETLTMEQLINGMLVYSANDAANVIATHISGTSEHFVELMNEKAAELGATNTNFSNAYGIHDENHYTTAADMAIIAEYAMQNEKFREIVKTNRYTIPATNKYGKERILPSTNLFLGTSRSFKYYNKRVTGIKTGYTSDAGYCLVSSATVDNTELLCVVMKCKNQDICYTNTNALLDYGFKNYKYQTITQPGDVITDSEVLDAKDDVRVAFTAEEEISALLPKEIDMKEEVEVVTDIPENIKAPITKGDVIGSVSYNYKGSMIGHSNLVATNDVERNIFLFIFRMIKLVLTSPFFFIPVIIFIIIFIIVRIEVSNREKLKRRRRLHQKTGARVMRDGTRRPVNTRYMDTDRKNSNLKRRKK